MLPDTLQLQQLQNRLGDDLLAFAPELLLCGGIVLALLLRLFATFDSLHRVTLGLIAVIAALGCLIQEWHDPPRAAFDSLLMLDAWAGWFRGFVLLATLIVLILSRFSGLPDRDDSGDYTVLLLGAALGLMLMASANHLLMVFLAMEMASLPSYALAGFLKGRVRGSEAALKYVIYGAAAGGVMLYGISLITARTGTGSLPALANALSFDIGTAAGLLFISVGLGYKLSIVPFHVWLPDAFEGAAAEVGAFLSVASKAGAVALIGRLLMLVPESQIESTRDTLGAILAGLALLTATFGNLMAYAQSDLKRLLGYSTIAHAGFLLAGLATISRGGFTATLVYLAAYLLANLGAFSVAAAIRNLTGREDISALTGLMRHSPALGIGFVLCILSLLGLPPLVGFAAKFLIFQSLYETGRGVWLVAFAVLLINTALGAGYYLRLLRIAVLDEGELGPTGKASLGITALVLLLAVASIAFGVFWSPLVNLATSVCR